MNYSIYTLGCKVNQYETQAMEQILDSRGHSRLDFDQACDCYIINTCTVTAVSDKKSRNIIRRVRKLNPNAILGVCGCYAQVDHEAVEALDVDVVVGTSGREEFLRQLEKAVAERTRYARVDDALRRRDFEILPAGGMAARTRAMLKVQDGCCNFCTYCIIPYARGPIRSLPLDAAVEQALTCAREGYRELVVTGIEISSWGVDFKDGSSLKNLLSALCEAVPQCRIRLGSLEPRTVDEAFCQTLSKYENLCPQFHLSLQSGSDTVLKRMHRKYDTARYLESVRLLKQYFPGCAVTTDLIVAFPGETEEEFRESLEFMRTCSFGLVHIFPYSRRAGTPAASMPGQHPNAVKEERAARAAEVAAELETAYNEAMVGKTYPVLFEQVERGLYSGHAPNYVKVYAQGEDLHNQVRNVKITGLYREGVVGELLLTREFYLRDANTLARELLGKKIVHKTSEGITAGIIVETEAYCGRSDKGAHAYGNKRTDRTEIQFGPGGFAYIYLIYGMHCCLNIVANTENTPECVLIRALEPVEGMAHMARRRGIEDTVNFCNGPGKLCQAMSITRAHYGADLCGGELWLEEGRSVSPADIWVSPRINIDFAEECKDLPWRYFLKDSPCVSKVQKKYRDAARPWHTPPIGL